MIRVDRRQASVMPYRIRRGRVEVALITSVRGKRWILPKGNVERGEKPWETALRESEEEAGLLGEIVTPAVGRYVMNKDGARCGVEVYLLRVTTEAVQWPEDDVRRRRWLPVSSAAMRLDGDLRSIVVRAAAQIERGTSASS